MSPKMQLVAKLDQRLAMNQQLRQAITLLQYNTIELKQLVQNYIENNPLIDVEESEGNEHSNESDSYSTEKSQSLDYTAALPKSNQYHDYHDENSLENYSIPQSLREYLLAQTLLSKFNHVEQFIAEAIIDAIDDQGYLTMSLDEIQKTIDTLGSIDFAVMQSVLKKIKTFDPIGFGAQDMQECLLIQLSVLSRRDKIWYIANRMITDCFDIIASNHTKKIIKKLGISAAEYTEAMTLIRSLDPQPGLQHSNEMDIISEP